MEMIFKRNNNADFSAQETPGEIVLTDLQLIYLQYTIAWKSHAPLSFQVSQTVVFKCSYKIISWPQFIYF